MPFEINDRVVYPAFGVGRIVGLMTKTLRAAESRMYYEVSGDRTTAWVQVEEGAARGLRPLTRKDELGHFRAVLRGRPVAMNADFRQRQLALRDQLKGGTLQCVCEVVRDLNGRSWLKALNESDLHTLRRSSDALCQEWAAADEITIAQATAEVGSLLRESRAAYAPAPAVAPVSGILQPGAADASRSQPSIRPSKTAQAKS
jgi:RNA polymerase-interacting CarD/CdnL/TRCF family regulator